VTNRLILILALLISTVTAWCQVTVTGTVVAKDDNLPVPGVTVVEKGTEHGTITKADGTFSIAVKELNSTLVFSFVGMATKEFPLLGKQEIFVTLKSQCFKDFFDAQKISFYANCGLINNPLGGQIEITSPWLLVGVVKGSYSYQANLNKNEFQNGQIELSHFISTCDFDMDFKWNYRQVSFDDDLKTKAYSFETDLNLRHFKLIAGYSHLDFNKAETEESEISSGVRVGFGRYFNIPLHPTATVIASLYKNKIEYQASLKGGYKRLFYFVKFYKLNSFNEISLGIGTDFGYRLKRQRR
jgi:hypothetical protein